MKITGLWILCSDFKSTVINFFSTVLLRVPDEYSCSLCKSTPAFFTQCEHVLCYKCFERGRKVNAQCPQCNTYLPRKWTLPFKYGTIPHNALFCIL